MISNYCVAHFTPRRDSYSFFYYYFKLLLERKHEAFAVIWKIKLSIDLV